MKGKRIVRYTPGVDRPPKDRTDWKRLRAMTDRDIEKAVREDPDAGPIRTAAWWRNHGRIVMPERKPRVPVSLRVEREVIDWFKAQGGPYQSRMHAVLKAFVEAHQS